MSKDINPDLGTEVAPDQPPFEAYKMGDLQSGNWQWAVGYPSRSGYGHRINVATINFHGIVTTRFGAEQTAKLLAAAMNNAERN